MLLWLEGAAFLGTSLILWWLSDTFVDPVWSWIGLCQFLWLCVLCFKLEPRGSALLLPIAITRASVVVALVAIEHGARIPELGLSGTPGPHTTSYVIVMAVLFASYLAIFRAVQTTVSLRRMNALTMTFDRFATGVSAMIVAIGLGATFWLLAIGAARGFPLLVNMDRFVFRRLYADNLTLNILNCKSLLAGALGLVSFCLPITRSGKRASTATLLLFIGTNFLFGDKFFIILSTLSSFLAPYLYLNYRLVRQRFALALAVGAAAMMPIMAITWYIYSDQGRASVESTSQRLTERFAAQGELWYLQTRIGAPYAKWDSSFVAGNIDAMSIKSVDLYALQHGLGPAYFMNLYSPDKVRAAQSRNAGAVTYTMALEPLVLANFGWFGLFAAMVLSGGLFALGSLYMAYAIERRLILSAIFSGYIMLSMRAFSTQGTPWVVASIFTLKWLSVVLGIELLLLILAASQNGHRLGNRPARRPDPKPNTPASPRAAPAVRRRSR